MAAPASVDATQQLETVPIPLDTTEPLDTVESQPLPPQQRRWLAALIALMLVTLIAVVVALTGDDEPLPVAADTTTIAPTTASTAAAPAETGTPDTTVAEEPGGVFNTVRVFVEFIRETPRNVLKKNDAEKIISDVADGVSEAIRGNDDEAQSNLAKAVETVEDEIESETVVDRAIELIGRLARQLGLDAEWSEP